MGHVPQTAPACPSPPGRRTIRCPDLPAPGGRTGRNRGTADAPALRRASAHPAAVPRRPAVPTPCHRTGPPSRRCRPVRRPAAPACSSPPRPAPPASPVRCCAAGAPARAGGSGAVRTGPAVPGVRSGLPPSYRLRGPGRVSGVRPGSARPRRRRPRRRPHRCRRRTSPRAGGVGAGVSGAWRAVVVPAGCPSVPAPPARPVPSLLTTVLVTLRAPVHPVVPGAG